MKKGHRMTEEHKRKIVETRRKNNSYHSWCKGKHQSEETKKKMCLAKRNMSKETKRKISLKLGGRILSEEIRRKISESTKKRWQNPENKKRLSESLKGRIGGMKGKHQSEESNRKNSLAHIGRILSKETRKKLSIKNKGKKLSEKHKQKISLAKIGIKRLPFTELTKRKMKINRSKQIFPIKDTSIEVKIQNFLKQLRIDFFTHQYIQEIEHGYQCDILIPSMNLVIECDGDYWHKYPIGKEIDHIRTKELIEQGFKVLRLWEYEINKMSINDIEERIRRMNIQDGIQS